MSSIVKVEWKKDKKWMADLLLVDETGFTRKELRSGDSIKFEVTNKRKCTGYYNDIGSRNPCPAYRDIEKGNQCFSCKKKDIYTGYVRGMNGLDTEKRFSVYLVQAGRSVKVGVTRSEKLERRWIEQGADFGAEIHSDLSSEEALKKEKSITETKGISQSIRKDKKVEESEGNILEDVLDKNGYNEKIVDLRDKTIYPEKISTNIRRKGRLSGTIKSVKGQIVSTERISMVMTSGKVVQKPVQRGLEFF